jgi:hypothetical protein
MQTKLIFLKAHLQNYKRLAILNVVGEICTLVPY